MDDISKGNLNRPELRDESSSSDDDFEQLERLSNQLPSFSEFRAFDSEYDEDEEDEDDDSDEDFGRIGSYFPRRRTFSRCDPPVYPLPEFKVYAESVKEKGENDLERSLKKFIVEYRAWSRIRRRMKLKTASLRATKSDGETVNLSYCIDDTKMSSFHSGTFLKRSLSAPPGSTAAAAIEQKKRTHKRFNQFLRSGIKFKQTFGTDIHKDSSSKTESGADRTEACLEDVDKIESSFEKMSSITYTEINLEETEPGVVAEPETTPKSNSKENRRDKTVESCPADRKSESLASTEDSLNKIDMEDSNESCFKEMKLNPPATESSVGRITIKCLFPSQVTPGLSNLPGTSKDSDVSFQISTEDSESSENNSELRTSPRTPKDDISIEPNLEEIRSTSAGSLVTEPEMLPSSTSMKSYPGETYGSNSTDRSKSESFKNDADSDSLESSNESSSEIKTNIPSERESSGTSSSSELYLKLPNPKEHSEKFKSCPETSLIVETGFSSEGSGGSLDSSSSSDTVSGIDYSEMSWATILGYSPFKSTPGSESKHSINKTSTSNFSDDNNQNSPPQITSDPYLAPSGVIKVPTKYPDSSKMDSEFSNLPGTSKDSNGVFKVPEKVTHGISPKLSNSPGTSEHGSSSSGSAQDMNVERRSAFSLVSPRSPANIFRRYSLPNLTKAPMKNAPPRSMNLDGPVGRRVVRSLFTGNYWQDGYTPYSRTSVISDEMKSLLRRHLARSGESSGDSSEKRAPRKPIPPKSKSKVCKKLFKSPPTIETNETQTLQDDSSVDLAGEVSNLNLYDVTHPPEDAATSKDLTSKRKGTSLIIEEHLSPSAKKIRSSKSDPEVACEKDASSEAEKQSSPIKETKDLQNTLSLPTTATETVSPKRKIEDIENGSKEIHPDKSAVKRTKTKSPTPDNENDSKKGLSEPEEEDNE